MTFMRCSSPWAVHDDTLEHRDAPGAWKLAALVAGLAALLTLPSLRAGLLIDDYHHKLVMQGTDTPLRLLTSRFDLFRLLDDPARIPELLDWGVLPWWTYPHIRAAFWRPVSSFTHWLDYLLWPQSPALMHAQSILWYAALAAGVALLYRRVAGAGLVAAAAAVLYVFDDAHATPVAFLANRNALIAAFFGVLTLIAHDRWRREGARVGAMAGPALLTLSLLAKEEGIATCAYLAAYALVLDPGSRRGRVLSLVPYAAVVVVWRILWVWLGYGIENVTPYVDPLNEPLRFLSTILQHGGAFLLAQLAAPPPDPLTLLEGHVRTAWIAGTWLLAACLIALLWTTVRADRVSRFWLVGLLLCIPPICTTFPSDRMLLFAGIGGMGLVARFVVEVRRRPRDQRPRWAAALAGFLVVLHLVLSPALLAARSAAPMAPRFLADRVFLRQPFDEAVRDQDVMVVNAPGALFLMEGPLRSAAEGLPVPRRMRLLSPHALRPVEVCRMDERMLTLHALGPPTGCRLESFWRGEEHPFIPGDRVALTGFTAHVLEVSTSGWPTRVAFRFDVPLEDPSLRWLQWRGGKYLPFTPPPVGACVTLVTTLRDLFP